MLSPADTIVEVNKISDDARVTVIVFRDSIWDVWWGGIQNFPCRVWQIAEDVLSFMGCRTHCSLSPKDRTVLSKAIVADVQELKRGGGAKRSEWRLYAYSGTLPSIQTADKTALCTGTLNSLLCLSTACNATSSFCDNKEGKWAECDVLDKSSHHTRGKATAEN